VALVQWQRSTGFEAVQAQRLRRLAGLLYGVAGAAIMWLFWPLFVVFLSNAPRLSAPWLERAADTGLGLANPLLAGTVDLALIGVFGLQHSLMARPSCKRRLAAILSPAFRRTTYVHAANVALFALILLWQPIPIELWHAQEAVLRASCWGLFALGWMILLGGALSFGMHELLGVRQVLDWYSGRQPRPLPLKTQGLYRWLRHPMYVGVVLAVWATPYMTVGHALLAAGLTVYVMIARRYEERDLGSAYGCAYQAWSGRC
jgi:methanethiol S-methyltransferase